MPRKNTEKPKPKTQIEAMKEYLAERYGIHTYEELHAKVMSMPPIDISALTGIRGDVYDRERAMRCTRRARSAASQRIAKMDG